jgi:hypothetical protein
MKYHKLLGKKNTKTSMLTGADKKLPERSSVI